MCGISGFVNFDGTSVGKEQFLSVLESLSHRGPDGNGSLLGDYASGATGLDRGNLGMAHNRLAIIDLSDNALQPMIDSDNRLILVFNGEIYNYRQLRGILQAKGHQFRTGSDSETILYAYKQWGARCVERLEGMFGFAIWDKDKQSMFVARDRLGIKPVYYYSKEGRFAVASEMKALLRLPHIEKKVNLDAASDYFETRYVPAPSSILQDIYKLEPGSYLTIDRDGIRKGRYWEIPPYSEEYLPDPEASIIERLDNILNETVQEHLVSDVPVGSFLSGGIDSSLITALSQKNCQGNIKTFTIGFDDKDFDEAPYAAKIAKYLGTDHHEHYISEDDVLMTMEQFYKHYDEPFGDSSAMPTLCLSRLSSDIFKTVLSGDGGDELFHGYSWFSQIEKSRNLFRIPLFARRVLLNRFVTHTRKLNSLSGLRERRFSRLISQKQAIFPDWTRKSLIGHCKGHYAETLDEVFSSTPSNKDMLYEKLGILGLKTWLPDDFMVKTDRASMAFGLEIRVPLLDHRVVEFAMKIHPQLKNKQGDSKYILKRVLEKYMPLSLFERKKKGFSVPLAKWLKTSLNPLVHDTLSASRVRKYGIMDETSVVSLVRDFEQAPHVEATRLWITLNFQLWCDEYLQ